MLRSFCMVVLCGLASLSQGGELINYATVAEVASNSSGGAEFAVRLSGGAGVCAGGAWIVFPDAKAPSPTSQKQAIATVLLAYSTGKRLRIHNFQDDSCLGANFVSIYD